MTENTYRSERFDIDKITTHSDEELSFRLSGSLPLKSGQFVEVSLPGVGEAPISVSDFGDDFFELTIRKAGSLTDALHTLKVGDGLWIRGPYGNGFPVERFAGRHLVIAAGGTGLAPVKSLIKRYCANPRELSGFDVVLGFRSPESVLFKSEIRDWSQTERVVTTVDKGDSDWSGNVGLITALIPELELDDIENTDVIVIGPPVMMKFAAAEFLTRGVDENHLWLSFERHMECGIGRCGHCRIMDKYVCLDGPVWSYAEAKHLID